MQATTRLPISIRFVIGAVFVALSLWVLANKAVSQESVVQRKADREFSRRNPSVAEESLKRFFRQHQKMRWLMRRPTHIDKTGRLQTVPGLWHWEV